MAYNHTRHRNSNPASTGHGIDCHNYYGILHRRFVAAVFREVVEADYLDFSGFIPRVIGYVLGTQLLGCSPNKHDYSWNSPQGILVKNY